MFDADYHFIKLQGNVLDLNLKLDTVSSSRMSNKIVSSFKTAKCCFGGFSILFKVGSGIRAM